MVPPAMCEPLRARTLGLGARRARELSRAHMCAGLQVSFTDNCSRTPVYDVVNLRWTSPGTMSGSVVAIVNVNARGKAELNKTGEATIFADGTTLPPDSLVNDGAQRAPLHAAGVAHYTCTCSHW